jgi:hypothetical protein
MPTSGILANMAFPKSGVARLRMVLSVYPGQTLVYLRLAYTTCSEFQDTCAMMLYISPPVL